MKKCTALLILFFIAASAFAQQVQWARTMGGAGADQATSIAVDAAGNSYTVGSFTSKMYLARGTGRDSLTGAGLLNTCIFKLDAAGRLVWAASIDGADYNEATGVVLDQSGHLYITGYYNGTVDLDPGAGVQSFTAKAASDVFVLRLDTAGHFIWARSMGGFYLDRAMAITLAEDRIGITGFFQAVADFNPGPAKDTLISHGGSDAFITLLDTAGNFLWTRGFGSTTDDAGYAIAIDAAGNVSVTGALTDTADLDPGAGVHKHASHGDEDIFILQLDAQGQYRWSVNLGGEVDDQGLSLTTDAAGNVYATGYFRSTVDFDPGPGTHILTTTFNAQPDVYILKLDELGHFVWAGSIGSMVEDKGHCIRIDPYSGHVYVVGKLAAAADLDPGPGEFNLGSAGNDDAFILALDTAGHFIAGKMLGTPSQDKVVAVAFSPGHLHIAGIIAGEGLLDTAHIAWAGDADALVCRLENCNAALLSHPSGQTVQIGADARFFVSTLNPQAHFQWQENRGHGFVSLVDTLPYSGVHNDTLTIRNAPRALHGFEYRCAVSDGSCSDTSHIAYLMLLDTGIGELMQERTYVYPNPVYDDFIYLHPAAVAGEPFTLSDQAGRMLQNGTLPQDGKIDMSRLDAGLYILGIQGRHMKIIRQ